MGSSLQAEENRLEIPAVSQTDALDAINELVHATEAALVRQKELRQLIGEYKLAEKASIDKPNDATLLFALAKAGKAVHLALEQSYLQDYFQPDFIQEVEKLCKIAEKKSIPPVQ